MPLPLPGDAAKKATPLQSVIHRHYTPRGCVEQDHIGYLWTYGS